MASSLCDFFFCQCTDSLFTCAVYTDSLKAKGVYGWLGNDIMCRTSNLVAKGLTPGHDKVKDSFSVDSESTLLQTQSLVPVSLSCV